MKKQNPTRLAYPCLCWVWWWHASHIYATDRKPQIFCMCNPILGPHNSGMVVVCIRNKTPISQKASPNLISTHFTHFRTRWEIIQPLQHHRWPSSVHAPCMCWFCGQSLRKSRVFKKLKTINLLCVPVQIHIKISQANARASPLP